MNDVRIGTVPTSAGCECSTEPLEVTFDDDATLPASAPGRCDVYRVVISNGGAAVHLGAVQVSVATESGELGACLFDGSASNPAPTCAARSLCDPPGFTAGVGAVAGSVCPICGAGGPSTIAQDLDGDGIGNTCDDNDAPLNLRRASLHRNTSTLRQNGSVFLSGDVRLAAPTDTFDASKGLVIRVTDGLALDRTFAFAPSDCRRRPSGFMSCTSADGHERASFVRSGKPPTRFRFRVTFDHLPLAGPFQPPLTVRLTDDPPVPIEGIDRVGVLGNCTVTKNGMHCRAP